jgi:AcrR family transcriptional regulator
MTEDVKRRYDSPARAAAAEQTRARLVETAARMLADQPNIAGFSLEAVAKAAGVTRLTVYNQFGSRRGLLEAVFDGVAAGSGLAGRVAGAMQMSDPRAALAGLIAVFCAFWQEVRPVARLHDAAASDPELAEAVSARNERRRHAITVLMGRMGKGEDRDQIDLIFTLTSYRTFEALRAGRTGEEACRIVTETCLRLLD